MGIGRQACNGGGRERETEDGGLPVTEKKIGEDFALLWVGKRSWKGELAALNGPIAHRKAMYLIQIN